ncbi:hypothetical protein SDJN02_07713, partial [Cucurbita argyrosperma subsp. argyrosperma]
MTGEALSLFSEGKNYTYRMELRSFSHLHYINVTKGGAMSKVLNVNSHGKPAVVFKKLTDIYKSIDDKTQESLPRRWSREGLEENIPDECEFKVETQVLYAERKLFNDEPEVSDSDNKGDTDGEQSDVEVDNMTLKQIMEGCKKRKLRQSRSVDSSKEKPGTCSRREPDHACLLSDEDDSDLNVALSIWKSKLSKCRKLKTKCDEGRISTSSHCGQTIGNSDPINSDQDLHPSGSDLPVPVDIKVETPEPDVTEIQSTNYKIDEWSLFCDENINSCLKHGPNGADESIFYPKLTTSEKEAEYCVLNSACHEYLEDDEPKTLQMVGESSNEWMYEDNLEVHKPHYSDFPASESLEGQCTPGYISNYSMSEAISSTKEQLSGTYITNEVIFQNNSEDMSEAIAPTEEQCCDTYISQCIPFTHEVISLNNLNSLKVQETSPEGEVCLTEISYKDKSAFVHEKGIPTESNSNCNLRPDHGKSISTNSVSDGNLSPDQHLISTGECPATERQPQMSNYYDSERNTPPDFHLDGSLDTFNQTEEPKRHPIRLLLKRTSISPTSQKRLSKGMRSMQLHDKEYKTCSGKPYFNQIKYRDADIYHKKNIRKSKKRSLHSASTTKVPQASMRSTAVQNCSDSAIAFTQRQMQDIECLALKLTNQLTSMKAIVDDRLHVEGNQATSFKFNTDEVRTAIADATKAEAQARKWLSIMSRDCNRFGKIMKTTEHGSNVSSLTAIQKVKRKITFADEAGGKLCEVRLIEDGIK